MQGCSAHSRKSLQLIFHAGRLARRAAQNKAMQATFVVDDSKPRKKARLSWYHPDDTVGA